MRRSGIAIIPIMVGSILAAGCAGYFAEKTTDPIYAQLSGSPILLSGNDPSSLVRPWYVKALIIEGTRKAPVPLTGIQLTFYNNGSFSGFDSCNPYTGRWQADAKRITIHGIESTMTWCNEPPGVMGQESEYFALLNNASLYAMNGEDMALSDTAGKNGLIFKQVFF
jgi:heat shock protein HslJ